MFWIQVPPLQAQVQILPLHPIRCPKVPLGLKVVPVDRPLMEEFYSYTENLWRTLLNSFPGLRTCHSNFVSFWPLPTFSFQTKIN